MSQNTQTVVEEVVVEFPAKPTTVGNPLSPVLPPPRTAESTSKADGAPQRPFKSGWFKFLEGSTWVDNNGRWHWRVFIGRRVFLLVVGGLIGVYAEAKLGILRSVVTMLGRMLAQWWFGAP